MNELIPTEFRASQGGSPRVRKMKKEKDQSALVAISMQRTWARQQFDDPPI